MSGQQSSLPTEILAEVFSRLSTIDMINLAESSSLPDQSGLPLGAASHCLNVITENRDPIRYLGSMFKNPEELLYNMGKHRTLLSGSRALEYFIEGSATKDSDWDFYCYSDAYTVYDTTRALEKAGVVWETCHDKLHRLVSNSKSARDTIVSKFFRNDNNPLIDVTDPRLNNLTEKQIRAIGLSQYDNVDYDISRTGNIRGTITKQNISHTVQLVYSTCALSPIEMITQFYCSAVQCFIGFECAAHMYYKPTLKKINYIWKTNVDLDDKLFEKYMSRGYRPTSYVTKKEYSTLGDLMIDETKHGKPTGTLSWYTNIQSYNPFRTLSDNISKVVLFDKYYDSTKIQKLIDDDLLVVNKYPVSHNIDYHEYILSATVATMGMSWYQLPTGTIKCPGIIELTIDSDILERVNPLDHTKLIIRATEQNIVKQLTSEIGMDMKDMPWTGNNSIARCLKEKLANICFSSMTHTQIMMREYPE